MSTWCDSDTKSKFQIRNRYKILIRSKKESMVCTANFCGPRIFYGDLQNLERLSETATRTFIKTMFVREKKFFRSTMKKVPNKY